jgi:hypothetical protein
VYIPKKINQNQHTNVGIVRLRFRLEIMESFTDTLKCDEMFSRSERFGNEDLSAIESYVRFNDIITESQLRVDSIHKKVVAKEPQAGTYSNVQVNSWYSEGLEE